MTEQRLLPYKKAAQYCGEPFSTFKAICPVQPIKLHDRSRPRLDVKDLDKWIDSKKRGGNEELSDDDIVNEL